MADSARKWTDKRLIQMEKHLTQIFRQSKNELTEKWNAYMQRGQDRLADLYADYVSAPADKKADALKRYQDAAQNFTLRNKWYSDMVDQTTYRLANVNQIAVSYINDELPAIYVENFNYIDPDALLIKQNWTIRNEQMVRNLIRDTLPEKEVNFAKDMAWNKRQINSSILQGILQGESIPKISKRLLPIVDNNKKAAIRTARTMVTGAENRGRLDRYQEYVDDGVIMTKVWIATPDHRVRDWHLSMDGQEVYVDEPFIDGHGEELDYPGDPSGSPQTVYNCRCSMRSQIIGVRQRDGSTRMISYYRSEPSFHERQISAERNRRGGT